MNLSTSIIRYTAPFIFGISLLLLLADLNPVVAQSRLQFSQEDSVGNESWYLQFDTQGNMLGRGIPVKHDLWSSTIFQPASENFLEIDSAWEWFAGSRLFNFWLNRGITHISDDIKQLTTVFPGIQFTCDGYSPSASIGNNAALHLRGSYCQLPGDCRRPEWEPERWNSDSVIRLHNNCYSYAVNQMINNFNAVLPGGSQPGYSCFWVRDSCRAAGGSRAFCNDTLAPMPAGYTERAIADGLVFLGLGFPGNEFDCADAGVPGGHLVFLTEQAPPLSDYHWYRLDANTGTWSHKHGHNSVQNVDDGQPGSVITNPQTCNRGSYTVARGFFCTCGQNARIR